MFSAIAPAKLNLYLHITGKRADGYHLLDSLVAFATIGDEVRVEASDDLVLTISGEFSEALVSPSENIVFRAAELLQDEYGITQGAAMHLTKNLPVGAGIGGGSSDAATALKLLCQLWGLQIPIHDLSHLGAKLGADVPACLHAKPLYMSGIGEVIEAAPVLPELHAVLVHPRIPLLTKHVYEAYKLEEREYHRPEIAYDSPTKFLSSLKPLKNDLQHTAITLTYAVGQVLLEISTAINCEVARMCGSGSTCFGLFEDARSAELAANDIRAKHPAWWVVLTPLQRKATLALVE